MRAKTLIVAIGCLLLSGCGIKGSLYLPDVPPPPSQDAPAAAPDHNNSVPAD